MNRLGGLFRPSVAAMALGALLLPGTAMAGSQPADQVSFNHFRTGAIKGIVIIWPGDPGTVQYALKGIPTTGRVRVVASTKPCSSAHTGADRALSWSLGASNPTGVAAGQFQVQLHDPRGGWFQSLRIFRGAGASDQRACTGTTFGTREDQTSAAITLENVLVSSLLKEPAPRGLVTVGAMDDQTIRVRALLLHKDRGRFRLVGSAKACSAAHGGANRVFSTVYNLGDTATHEVGHWISVDQDLMQPSMALRSIRLFKGSGAGQQIECRGIIAVLIGL